MAGRLSTAGRARAEMIGVSALAVLVHGSAVVGVVLGGLWTLVWFLPAMLGSLVAIWFVREGIRAERSAATGVEDGEESREGDLDQQ
ncbi:hypothetical protein ACFVAF_20210 [Streptomyces sp. NPDC057596]|uniref:hypothetical protein n=1 Tax=Streptomyces sp. NPDC057596 TaxID=3346178 RepID=UPI0036BE8954